MLALVGCRDRSTEQDAQDDLCAELAELDGSVVQVAALEPTAANVARLRQLRTQMEAQFREVQESSEDVGALRVDAITQAYNNVLRTINGVNDEATFRQAEPQIDAAAGEFSTARLDLHTQAGC